MTQSLPPHLQDAICDIAAISASALGPGARLNDIEERLSLELPFVAINQSLLTDTCALKVHRTRGYSDRILRHLTSEDFRSDLAAFEKVGNGRSLRMSDLPAELQHSPTVQDFILPEGFRDGVTTPLVGNGGRLIGFQHLSFEERGHLGDDIRDFLDRIARVIAALVDPVAGADHTGARGWALIDGEGNLRGLTGQVEPALLAPRIILRALRMAGPEQALWLVDLEDHLRLMAVRRTSYGTLLADLGPVETPLTRRELEVAALLPQGLSNSQIASVLGITPRTANAHVAAILTKLDVMTRAAAAARIVTTGWRLL